MGQRAFGFLIDGLVLSIPASLVRELGAGRLALLAVALAYVAASLALRSATPGQSAVRALTVSAADGSPLAAPAAVVRALVLCLPLALPPVLGVPAALAVLGAAGLDAARRGLHDRAAGTLVVSLAPSA